ncbi:MAG: hypothetical protein ACE5HA_17375 [Anaerolineae bacterium]
MDESVFALPVSVEQVAAVIKQMSPTDQRRLLDLVPDLRQVVTQAAPRTVDEARAAVERVRAEVMQALSGQSLSPTELFLGDLTLGQYLNLSDEDRARLWDEWAEVDLEGLEELDVRPDAVPAR